MADCPCDPESTRAELEALAAKLFVGETGSPYPGTLAGGARLNVGAETQNFVIRYADTV